MVVVDVGSVEEWVVVCEEEVGFTEGLTEGVSVEFKFGSEVG